MYDRRLGKVSARRVPMDTAMDVLKLFDTRSWDFTVRHFPEKLVVEHAFERSNNWTRLTLQVHGRVRKAPRRCEHRRPRRPHHLDGAGLGIDPLRLKADIGAGLHRQIDRVVFNPLESLHGADGGQVFAVMQETETRSEQLQGAGSSLSRDCLSWFDHPPDQCPRCASARMISHPELAELTIAHIDCDALYAAIDKRDDPTLKDKPVIAGHPGGRGAVTTRLLNLRLSSGHGCARGFNDGRRPFVDKTSVDD